MDLVIPKLALSSGMKELTFTATPRNPIKGFDYRLKNELSIPLKVFGNKARLFNQLTPLINAHFMGQDLSKPFSSNKKDKNMKDNIKDAADNETVVEQDSKLKDIKDPHLKELILAYQQANSLGKKALASIALIEYETRLAEIKRFKRIFYSMLSVRLEGLTFNSNEPNKAKMLRSFVENLLKGTFIQALSSIHLELFGEEISKDFARNLIEQRLIDKYTIIYDKNSGDVTFNLNLLKSSEDKIIDTNYLNQTR